MPVWLGSLRPEPRDVQPGELDSIGLSHSGSHLVKVPQPDPAASGMGVRGEVAEEQRGTIQIRFPVESGKAQLRQASGGRLGHLTPRVQTQGQTQCEETPPSSATRKAKGTQLVGKRWPTVHLLLVFHYKHRTAGCREAVRVSDKVHSLQKHSS